MGIGRAALDGTQADENFVAPPPGTYGYSRGVAVVPFSGRIRRRALEPGGYRAVFVAAAATGRATHRRTFAFHVVRP